MHNALQSVRLSVRPFINSRVESHIKFSFDVFYSTSRATQF